MTPRRDRPVVCPADEWHQGNWGFVIGNWGWGMEIGNDANTTSRHPVGAIHESSWWGMTPSDGDWGMGLSQYTNNQHHGTP